MKRKYKRAAMTVLGTTTVAVGVGLLRFARFGVDPFTTLMLGMDQLIPLDYGTVYILVNGVMLIFSLLTHRKYIGLGTVMNLVITGYIAEITDGFLKALFPQLTLPAQAAVFALSLLVLCFGSAMYMTADMGVSAYDAVAMVMAYKWKLWKFKYLRICTDFFCVAAGVALFLLSGGTVSALPGLVGVGTIVTAFFMGPVITFFSKYAARWLESN